MGDSCEAVVSLIRSAALEAEASWSSPAESIQRIRNQPLWLGSRSRDWPQAEKDALALQCARLRVEALVQPAGRRQTSCSASRKRIELAHLVHLLPLALEHHQFSPLPLAAHRRSRVAH